MKQKLLLLIFFTAEIGSAGAQGVLYKKTDTVSAAGTAAQQAEQAAPADTIGFVPYNALMRNSSGAVSLIPARDAEISPYADINQALIGKATGVEVRIPSAEPGKRNAAFIRGLSSLMLDNADVMNGQPTYVVDGIPLILDHPFAYDIQRFGVNRLGTEINLLSFLNINDIQSIEVLKDFEATAKYGPLAANGVVNITTYGPRAGKLRVSVNSYVGYALSPDISTTNAAYERDFRLPFYQQYASTGQWQNFPAYLADSTRPEYYGAADWDDLYYRNAWSDGIQAAISGGGRLANFRFSIGQLSDQGVADGTGMNRYNVNFGINIMPVKDLLITTRISAATINRTRNHFLRDRISDEDYVIDLETPPSPNKAILQQYYDYLADGIDDNKDNTIQVMANAQYTFSDKWKLNSRFGIDYVQNFRDLFIPSTLGDGNNFASNFQGLNKRLVWDNSLEYHEDIRDAHHFGVTLGMYTQWDKWSYNYGKAYKGKSDYIKVYEQFNNSNNYQLTANYKDILQSNLASFYANLDYNFKEKYFLSFYLREDGSSDIPAENKWLFSPTVSAAWELSHEKFLSLPSWVNKLNLRASWGLVGKRLPYDYYNAGPVYDVNIGWNGTPNVSTYDAYPVLNASYGLGYITEGIQWPVVEQGNIGLQAGFFDKRLRLQVDFYAKTYRDLLLKVPVMEEHGYTGVVKNGMDIRNRGYEVSLEGDILQKKDFQWTAGFSAYANSNTLMALPGGAHDITIGDRHLVVGKPVDDYWVLVNDGIYRSDEDVPVDPATKEKMSYQGLALRAGDPRWRDLNGDYVIDERDRVLKGSLSPDIAGSFTQTFQYRNMTLGFLFNYAFGREVINQALADRFDFANREGADDLTGVKEVTYWQQREEDYESIPQYNPWSPVQPYQANQTLFLQDASFIKLRTVSFSYDFRGKWMKKAGIERFRLYATADNLWTRTPYKGGDPEAVSYFGYDEGDYNWGFPKRFVLGFNFRF
ncbi:SusC/RagA family TonB-linked outer membrane protein [Compostibacter hankyongensis]|uniref:SusC/RagA family TonB-linked outer membrane protein n=1 Tax=Compostibacter hankyongensis TaxID=1007089 RepID=A0ABP8FT17_9BACT